MRKFGEIVVDEGFATEEQINSALTYQKTSDILVGKILVDMRVLTHAQVERVSNFLKTPDCKGKRFGEAAVFLGACTDSTARARRAASRLTGAARRRLPGAAWARRWPE